MVSVNCFKQYRFTFCRSLKQYWLKNRPQITQIVIMIFANNFIYIYYKLNKQATIACSSQVLFNVRQCITKSLRLPLYTFWLRFLGENCIFDFLIHVRNDLTFCLPCHGVWRLQGSNVPLSMILNTCCCKYKVRL